jgi:uncharacterized protein YkwD
MSRALALTAALCTLVLVAVPAAGRPIRVRCARVHSASFHRSSCPARHGRPHRQGASHALFFIAHNGHCPDARLAPSPQDIARVRAATLCLINRERARHGEQPLRPNNKLIGAAQAHTRSMIVGDYFAHTGPGGQTPLSRIRATGYISSHSGYEVGENIGWGSLWLGTPRSIVAAWMSDAGHRANILDPRFRETGIGVLAATPIRRPGATYTEDFGTILGRA